MTPAVPRDYGRAMTRTRTVAADVALATGLVAAMVVEALVADKPDTQLTPGAVVAIIAATAPVLARRRWPGWAFAAALVLLFPLFLQIGIYQTIPFPAAVIAYSVALTGSRTRTVAAAAAGFAVALVALGAFSPHGVWSFETAKNLVYVAVPLLAGLAMHSHRAYLCSLHERAEIAERTREEETMRRIGEERLRIARDLHDLVTHSMVAINVQAGVAAHLIDRDPEQARAGLTDIKRVSGEALTDLRATLDVVRGDDAAPVAPTSRLSRVDDLGSSLRAAGIEVDTDLGDDLDRLPAAVDEAGFRIVQEALTNVLRHARPRRASVVVRTAGDHLEIDVSDDGTATSPPGPGGHGIAGMHARAAALGGTVDAGRREDGGWRVAARIPAGVR